MKKSISTLSVEIQLPCGCQMRHSVKAFDQMEPEHYPQFFESGMAMLESRCTLRATKHQCDLVSEDNPFGQPRSN